ncbi:hypothetical protein ACI65C_009909 [Semiaphis heraclei]
MSNNTFTRPIKTNVLKKNIIQRKKTKTNTAPASWVNNRTKTKVQYKYTLTSKFMKKIRTLEHINRRLIVKIRSMENQELIFQDFKIKYLTLKEKVLEAEEQLLINGIDTSEYPLFCMDYVEQNTQDTGINNEIKIEVPSDDPLYAEDEHSLTC